MMNLDELQSVRDRERQTDKPQQLRESFYTDVGAFVEQLRAERDRVAERDDDPYAPEAMRLKDEIDAARQLVEDIHECRIGKIVKAASLEAADLSAEVNGLTGEEQELFAALVDDIERHREHVLDVVDGATPDRGEVTTDPTDDTADAIGAGEPDGNEAAPETGPGDRPEPASPNEAGSADGDIETADGHGDTPARSDGAGVPSPRDGGVEPGATGPVERERVLITEDIDTFVGFDDRDYDLAADDVVTLPATNADLLVERDAARRL